MTPDFSLSISNTPMTIFAGQVPPQFNGTITALGGYNSQVNLSCAPVSTCIVNPTFVNPPGGPPLGTPLTATVSPGNTPGDYTFDLHGAGTDANRITNDAAFTLQVVDFNLTAPSPASITVPPSNVSGPVSFQVTAQGSFEDTVNLSCGNLPSGASCNFLPSGSVNPTSSSPVAVTLTVSTTADATAGTVPITINGSVTNGPTKTQSLSLTITLDYSLVISNPALQAYVNSTVNFNGVLTSLNGYNSGVNLSCGAGAPPTCSAAPALVVPTASGAPFIVTVGSPACGSYNFNIVAAGTDAQKTSHLFPVTFTANSYTTPNYTLDVTPGSQTAAVNAAAIFNGTLQGTDCYNSAGEFELRVEPSPELQRFSEQPCAHRESGAACALHRNCKQRGRPDLQLRRCGSGHGSTEPATTGAGEFYLDRRLRHAAVQLHHHTIVQHSVVASGTACDLRA